MQKLWNVIGVLAVVDDYTRECLSLIARSIEDVAG